MSRPSQIGQGQRITADWLNQVVHAILRTVIGGRNIAVRRVGNQIVIDHVGNPIIRQGGAQGSLPFYSVDTESSLPVVDAPAMGYTQDEEDYYIRRTGGWVKLTGFALVLD